MSSPFMILLLFFVQRLLPISLKMEDEERRKRLWGMFGDIEAQIHPTVVELTVQY